MRSTTGCDAPTYDDLLPLPEMLESIICSDFEYLEDAQLFLAENWDYFVTEQHR